MRTLLILMMAFLLPLSALDMSADEKEQILKIPLLKTDGSYLRRDLVVIPIESYYYASMGCIITSAYDYGEVIVSIYNTSTGESWGYIVDSNIESQSFLQISGNPGYYEVEYILESGETYVGSFVIL